MRFLIDENLPQIVADALRGAGHDAVHVYERDLRAKPDEIVFNTACIEERIVVTGDRGFGDRRIYDPVAPCGIVVFRHLSHFSPERQAEIVLTIFENIEVKKIEGCVTVIDPSGARARMRGR